MGLSLCAATKLGDVKSSKYDRTGSELAKQFQNEIIQKKFTVSWRTEDKESRCTEHNQTLSVVEDRNIYWLRVVGPENTLNADGFNYPLAFILDQETKMTSTAFLAELRNNKVILPIENSKGVRVTIHFSGKNTQSDCRWMKMCLYGLGQVSLKFNNRL